MVPSRYQVRSAVNWMALATPLGLLVASATRCHHSRGPRGMYFATGYRPRYPKAAAFTIGNVVILRHDRLLSRPALLAHEEQHATQWACCLGIFGFPWLYWSACGWSLIRTGDHYSQNTFERRAGLKAGGYRERPVRRLRRQ